MSPEVILEGTREMRFRPRPIGDAARLIALLRERQCWSHQLEQEMPAVGNWTRVRAEARRILAGSGETIQALQRAFGYGCLWAIVPDYAHPRPEEHQP